ncbi:MAG: hypothetical protein JWM87_2529 [Candidatus Eremiobacteraeota bacterium]|nr:hypothetical protein [Candidatus Eremiobacteraeota bacterium]
MISSADADADADPAGVPALALADTDADAEPGVTAVADDAVMPAESASAIAAATMRDVSMVFSPVQCAPQDATRAGGCCHLN